MHINVHYDILMITIVHCALGILYKAKQAKSSLVIPLVRYYCTMEIRSFESTAAAALLLHIIYLAGFDGIFSSLQFC